MTEHFPLQLSLGVSLRDDATFENFYCANKNNAHIVALMRSVAIGEQCGQFVFWGSPGVGVTHLLQAMCHEAYDLKFRSAQYLPIPDLLGFSPADICDGLEGADMVCLDGIDHLCGNKEWEQTLFHLFNNLRDAGHSVIMSAHSGPPSLPILLPDLKSRILGSMIYRLESLKDQGKQQALIQRASARGIELPDDVATFIMRRASRDMNELFYVLNRLDEASLQQQRKLTIPFVKDVLGI